MEHDASMESRPALLFGIFCLKFALSENAMKALLDLLKLGLDFSAVTSIDQILQDLQMAQVRFRNTCRSCQADVIENCCSEEW